MAWTVAGWETAEVDMDDETLLLRRTSSQVSQTLDLDDLWPVHRTGGWPREFDLRREEIYDERI